MVRALLYKVFLCGDPTGETASSRGCRMGLELGFNKG